MSQDRELLDAITRGDIKSVKALLKQGVDVNEGDRKSYPFFSGWTPLTRAIDECNNQIAKILLSHGASVNSRA